MTNHEPLPQEARDTNATETTRLLSSSSPSPSSSELDTLADAPTQDEAERLAALKLIPWYRRPSIYWLFPFVFLVAIIMGVASVPLEQVIIQIICKEYYSQQDQVSHPHDGLVATYMSVAGGDNGVSIPQLLSASGTGGSTPFDRCKTPEVQAVGAMLLSQLRALKNIAAMLTVGYWTGLLDRYGRKSLIWATLVPVLFSQIIILYSASSYNRFGTKLLWVEAFAQGITGGSTLLDPALQAYTADTTARDGRSLVIGYVMVTLALGMIIGPILGKAVIRYAGGRDTAAIEVLILCLIISLLYAAIIPESLPEEAKRRAKLEDEAAALEAAKLPKARSLVKKATRYLKDVFTPILIFVPGRIETVGDVVPMPHKYTLILLLLCFGLQQFVFFGITDVFIPYTNVRFGWTSSEGNTYVSFVGVCSLAVFLVLYPLTQKIYRRLFFKKSEEKTAESEAGEETTDETAALLTAEEHDNVGDRRKGKLEMTRDTTWLEVHLFGIACALYFLSTSIIPLRESESSIYIAGFLRAAAQAGDTNFASLITMYAPAHQVGKVLGGSCVVNTINVTISALSFGWIFSQTSKTMPSFVYVFATLFSLMAILVYLVFLSMYKRHDRRVARQLKAASTASAAAHGSS